MGAWADLPLDAATLKGMAPTDMTDPTFNEHDSQRATDDTVQNAKDYIGVRLVGAIPSLIVKSPGPDAFMDAAVAITNMANTIQQMLSRAFLYHYYSGEAFSNLDIYEFKKEQQMNLFDEAFTAFVTYIQLDVDFLEQLELTSDTGLDKYKDIVWVA